MLLVEMDARLAQDVSSEKRRRMFTEVYCLFIFYHLSKVGYHE